MKKYFNCSLVVLSLILLTGVFTWGWFSSRMYQANGEIFSAGEKRAYLLYVPESYDADKPAPLVVTLHGFASWPQHIQQISRWNQLADEYGFIVVYPRGTSLPMRWRIFGRFDWPSGVDADINFISDLIDELSSQYNIDPTRVYVNGKSNGAGMAFALACRLSGRIAAFGGVAGGYTLPWENCKPSRPVPGVIIHGDADLVASYMGGPTGPSGAVFPSIPDWVSRLAQLNRCSSLPVNIPSNGNVRAVRFTGCAQEAEVDFYTILDGGHTWPGDRTTLNPLVGHTSQDIDATRVMWEFFRAHPMR